MGEEEKKAAEEAKPEEEGKKEEAAPPAAKAEEKAAPPPEDGNKEEKKPEESKEEQTAEAPPPPPPPQEIVLRVFMHCEGCARKVRRCLKGFEGVEEVIADCRTSKVVVKGEKADPVKVVERVQKKSHRKVELISPIPKPTSLDKPQLKEVVLKSDDKTEEVITVVLRVYMHCDACAQEIKRRIQRMKGVETAEPDLKNSQVKVTGVFQPQKLVDHVYKRTGKHAAIIQVEPEKKEEEKPKQQVTEEKEKKADDEGAKKDEPVAKDNKDGGGGDEVAAAAAGEPPEKPEAEAKEAAMAVAEVEDPKPELRKNEFYYYYPQNYQMYPPRLVQEMNAYPPQMFSDENPNACSVM